MQTYSALLASSFALFAAVLVFFGAAKYSIALSTRGRIPAEINRMRVSDAKVCMGVGAAVLAVLRFL